ncbi:MAG: NUDIX domain-containing protein [Acidimicrobiales bacterium]
MAVTSAGLLLHRLGPAGLEVLLVHPGGPFWAKKDEGAWSVPKGELDEGEEPHAAALREVAEELGLAVPVAADGREDLDLGEVRQRGGKVVRCFARRADLDVTEIASNQFELEWPPRSGRRQSFPEVDRAEWFDLATARRKLLQGQVSLLDRLAEALGEPPIS